MTAFFSEAITEHDRSTFTSGNERIDGYFRQTIVSRPHSFHLPMKTALALVNA